MTETSTTSGPGVTRLAPKWLGKQILFILVVTGFAIWALADAVYIYPKRGAEAAEFLKLQYLKAALAPGVLEKVGVEDPAAELASLNAKARTELTQVQRLRAEWLEALRNAGKLEASRTALTDARGEMEALEKRFTTTQGAPKPLSKLDIPVQWAIMVVCATVSGVMIVVLLRALSTKYRYDAASQTLTLPGGVTLTPSDIEVFDKRKWDKFLIFLKVKAGAHPLSGQEVRLDLLRHVPLEDWVLEMEKTVFPPPPEGQASPSAMLMTQPGLGTGAVSGSGGTEPKG